VITSRSHDLVKRCRSIARGDERLALLDGWHLLDDALGSDVRLITVAVTAPLDGTASRVLSHAASRGAEIIRVSNQVMEALSPVRTPTGVISIVERKFSDLSELWLPEPALVVVAVDMQDPGNVGALIRAAEAGGATGVALTGASADPWSWKALRAAMGSTMRCPVLRTRDSDSLIASIRARAVRLLATVPRGGTLLYRADLTKPVAILVGGEGAGLAEAIVDSADERVSIPMRAPVDSLNAAVAAALFVYEAQRQRNK